MTETQKFKHGDVREDGFIFGGYKANGYEQWNSPDAAERRKTGQRLLKAAKRTSGLPFDIDAAYLDEIWPEDGLCPVFGTPMVRGGKRDDNSAELDRTDPEKGYVRGNVVWLSKRANRIKTDATLEELERVANYLRNCT